MPKYLIYENLYRVDNIKIAPCIWDHMFIDNQTKELKIESKDFSFSDLSRSVLILEPNLSIIKIVCCLYILLKAFEISQSANLCNYGR